MSFKYKTKIGCLLKELSIPQQEMSRFGQLSRIEDILHFLSDKVRENIVKQQID
jgi:hypothetical protein